MLQSQYKAHGREQPICVRDRNPLLERHPVVVPLLLLAGACIAAAASLASESIFPLLTLIGMSPSLLCLSIALVLGISGILTSIVGLIERIDGSAIKATAFHGNHSFDIFDLSTHSAQKVSIQRVRWSKVFFQFVRGYCNVRGYWNNKEQKLC